MYQIALVFHSWWRWVVLLLGLWSLYRASDERLRKRFISALDLQVLVGLVMYAFLSPFSQAVFAHFRASMKVPTARFFGLEHISMMILAAVVAHIGNLRVKRAPPERRRRLWLITMTIFFVMVLASIPWPFFAYGRPLFRW